MEAIVRIFVTGASGWIGSAVVPELQAAGHEVVGLARSDAAAKVVANAGAEVVRGELADLDLLRATAEGSDGVVHLGYVHDFTRMPEAAATDRAAINTFGAALAGSGRPLLIASGVLGLASGRAGTEQDRPDPAAHPRIANAELTLAFAEQDVRAIVVRFAPTVHGAGDHGFVARLVEIARERGASGYVGQGANVWPAVHRADAARLVRLAVDAAPAGAVLHAVGEEGVPTRAIAEAIGRGLGLPVGPAAPEEFGWLGGFFAADCPTSSARTQQQLAWAPEHPGLIADLDAGHYYAG